MGDEWGKHRDLWGEYADSLPERLEDIRNKAKAQEYRRQREEQERRHADDGAFRVACIAYATASHSGEWEHRPHLSQYDLHYLPEEKQRIMWTVHTFSWVAVASPAAARRVPGNRPLYAIPTLVWDRRQPVEAGPFLEFDLQEWREESHEDPSCNGRGHHAACCTKTERLARVPLYGPRRHREFGCNRCGEEL